MKRTSPGPFLALLVVVACASPSVVVPSASPSAPTQSASPVATPGTTVRATLTPAPAPTPALTVSPSPQPSMVAVEPAPVPAKPVAEWAGTWTRMPPAPIEPRGGAATAYAYWTDSIVIWGGVAADGQLLKDGASFDVKTRRWTKMPPAPIGARRDAAVAATGPGIAIWGGFDPAGRPLADGALYETRRRRWTTMGASRLPGGTAQMTGDINGLYVIQRDPSTGAPVMAVYHDGWLTPEPPLPIGSRYQVIAPIADYVWMLSEQTNGEAFALTGTEIEFPRPKWSPVVKVPVSATMSGPVASLHGVAWLGSSDSGGSDVAGVIGFWPDLEMSWLQIPASPVPLGTDSTLLWSPQQLVSAATLTAFDPVERRWQTLPQLRGGARSDASVGWAHGRLYVWSGVDAAGSLQGQGWIFTPQLPPDTYRLPGGYLGGHSDCGGQIETSRMTLRANRDDPRLVWFDDEQGFEVPTFWPDGYFVHFGQGAEILGPHGQVFARAGDSGISSCNGYF